MDKEARQRQILGSLEWHKIDPKTEFYDEVEHRIFINTTPEKLLIGFGHNTRRLELVAIMLEPKGAEVKDPELKKLLDEEVTDEE